MSVSNDATFKLYYFDARGKAEFIRLILAAADKKYEDSRFPINFGGENKEWQAIKPSMPFEQVPVLEITDNGNTTKVGQSTAIARFLAQRFDLAGKTDLEQTLTHMYVEEVNDTTGDFGKIFREKDEEKKKQLIEEFKKNTLSKNLGFFEKHLAKNNTGFLVGSSLTWADLAVFNLLDSIKNHLGQGGECPCDQYPNLKKLKENVEKTPRIAKWLETRPKTPF